MHILLVVGEFPRLTFIVRMALALAKRGHRVTVMARGRGDWMLFRHALPLPLTLEIRYTLPDSDLSDPHRTLDLLARFPGMVARAPRKALRLWRTLRGPRRLRQFILYLPFLSLRPDVIQFEFPMTAHIYRLLPELLNAPTVVSCRGADVHMLEQRDPNQRALRLESLRTATALHCVSEEMAGEVRRLSGRTGGIWVNRPAVPVDEIAPKTSYTSNGPPMIVAVGRLTWKKGFDYLLAALARLKRSGCAFRAQIIGEGELYSALRFSISDLGLSEEVRLVGVAGPIEVLRLMREADVFVLSSHEEGISNAALEAMACGLPIVTTAAGGMAEAVRDGIEGFVVPVRDIAAMTDRMGRLLADPALRERMGRAARARAEAEFSLERQVAIFEQIYSSVATPGAKSGDDSANSNSRRAE